MASYDAQRAYTMRYRLPLELELTILELAAPPLVKPRLVDHEAAVLSCSRFLAYQATRLGMASYDAIASAQAREAIVESLFDAPQCTFKFLRSDRSPGDALADALAALKPRAFEVRCPSAAGAT
jgi:hypothetical protein